MAYSRAKQLAALKKARAAKKRTHRNRVAGAKKAIRTKRAKYGKNLRRG